MKRILRRSAWLSLLVMVVACGAGQDQAGGDRSQTGRIEGTVYYRERMLLPPGALLEVQLQDISRPDAMASVLDSVQRTLDGGPPYSFAIDYQRSRIDPHRRYALWAGISVEGRLMFTTTEYIDPFAGKPLEVLVQRMAEFQPR